MMQRTLDMLILQTLVLGPAHGHTIANAIDRGSEALQVEHGSLYPTLRRLEDRGWIASFWGTCGCPAIVAGATGVRRNFRNAPRSTIPNVTVRRL